jgi:hypothetical protein
MEYLGLYNKPKAVVHPEHKLMGPKKKKKKKKHHVASVLWLFVIIQCLR